MRFQLEQQYQSHETKVSGWSFDKVNLLTIQFHKATEMNGSIYVKFPMRNSTILKSQSDDKYCFLWSILASLFICQNSFPNRMSNYRQYFDELNFQ